MNKALELRRQPLSDLAFVKMGIDTGGNFIGGKTFKVNVSVVSAAEIEERNVSSSSSNRKRRHRLKFSESYLVKKAFKSTGVKRLLPLAVFPNIGEKYESVRSILDWMKYDLVRTEHDAVTFLCADFKVILPLVGMQTAASSHPCPYCFMHKDHFDCSSEHVCPNSKERTFEANYEQYCQFQAATDGDRRYAQAFFNVVNRPMFIFPESGLIIHSVPPPELHIYIGIFNHLFDFGVKFSEEWMHWWAFSLHQTREAYFGGTFEGNESQRLMDRTIVLRNKVFELKALRTSVEQEGFDLEETDGVRPDPLRQIERILDLMDLFEDVVLKCFGYRLESGYAEAIHTLKAAWLNLRWGPSVTLKAHVVFNHLGDWCRASGRGLGLTSEQALESVHAYFKVIHQRNHVKEIHNPRWAEQMMKTVLQFASMNCII
jgi:hypothetical protein